MTSLVVIPKMLLLSIKVKLGITPAFDVALEKTANTNLDFHACARVDLCFGCYC